MNRVFSGKAWEEYLSWQTDDKKTLRRINLLMEDISRNKNDGIGKPEALTGRLSGFFSRRIDDKNRLVYRINVDNIEIVQCKGHYDDR